MTDSNGSLQYIADILKSSTFFSSFLPDELSWLAGKSFLALHEKDSVLFRAGETARHFFMVKSGTVLVSRLDEKGQREEMARFVSGDTLGDFDFSRGAVYDAEAVCDEASELLIFPAPNLTMQSIMKEKPDVANKILLRAVIMISSRVRSTQALISDNAPWVRELRRQVYTDSATGLWSRNFLDDEFLQSLGAPSALLLVKPDRFKELCDTWTHSAGDFAMEKIAAILKNEARAMTAAWAIRLKSNETAIIASYCSKTEALGLAERIALSFQQMDLGSITGNSGFKLSASMALSIWPDDGKVFGELLDHTYSLLMKVWKEGGNQIFIYSDDSEACKDAKDGPEA